MYTKTKPAKTTISVNQSYQGETIEQKVNRIVNNKEPITDGAPLTFTDRKEGVKPEYDIRTDRFEVAIDAMTLVTKTEIAKRLQRIKDNEEKTKPTQEPTKDTKPTDGGAEPTGGTK